MNESFEMSSTTEDKDPKRNKSVNKRILSYIKSIICVLCVIGLIYQVTTLIIQYLEYKTVVNVKFETIKYNRLPAISVCYPRFVSMNRTIEKFPQLRPAFEEYRNALKNVTDNDYRNNTFRQYLNNIYEEKFEKFIDKQNLTVGQWSDLSFGYNFPINSSKFIRNVNVPIEVIVVGLRRFEDGHIELFTFSDTQPIESIVFPALDYSNKCFTFNSHLNKSIRQYQMDIKIIVVKINHHEDWFPPTLYPDNDLKIWFAMHSANTLPADLDTFMELESGYRYEIRYNRWKTTLLPAPYETDCVKYDMDSDNDYKLRSDCIHECIQKEVNALCSDCSNGKCQQCLIRWATLWRMDELIKNNYTNIKLCADIPPGTQVKDVLKPSKDLCVFHHLEPVVNKCQVKCKPDCLNRYFNFDVRDKLKFVAKDKVLLSDWNRGVRLFIGHNQMPDQITEHTEDMTFVDFFGTFGGLFGVWLGLSALAILHFLLNHFE